MEVSHFLKEFEPEFLNSLYEFDKLEAERVKLCGCPHCGGKLDRSDYWRNPRGLAVLESKYKRRFSFCCRVCRRRVTPGSVRFLGRKVYLGLVIVLISYLRQGQEPVLLKRLCALSGSSEVTIRRWLSWWQNAVVTSDFWRGSRSFFVRQLNEERFVFSLYAVFRSISNNIKEALQKLLQFFKPITIPSQYPS